jgi:hypothetical protein
MGGVGGTAGLLGDLHAFDLVRLHWSPVPLVGDFPSPRSPAAAPRRLPPPAYSS